MTIHTTCPACQHISVTNASITQYNPDYFTTHCGNCPTHLHFDKNGKILAYFMDATFNNNNYQLCFYVVDTPSGSHKANTFLLSFQNKRVMEYHLSPKWEDIINLPFLPRINHNNLQTKLKLMLIFL
jgi:hypothetical protein